MKKYLILIVGILGFVLMGCSKKVEIPKKPYLKSNCKLIGYIEGRGSREYFKTGFKCPDNLEYWIYLNE